MARVDDYINARTLALRALNGRTAHQLAGSSGFEQVASDTLKIPFIDRSYRFTCFPNRPEVNPFTNETDQQKEVPLQEQVLILHYLQSAHKADRPSGNYISYREMNGASFYFQAFGKRALTPLKRMFGQNLGMFRETAVRLNGKLLSEGDAASIFHLFPKVAIQVILWEKDEEFDSEATILFDRVAKEIFSAEDAAWLAATLVYRLIGASGKK